MNGQPKNELERVLAVALKCIELFADLKGVVFDKDTPYKTKITYKDAAEGIKILSDKFALEGCFSMGICKTCTSLNQKGNFTSSFGQCQKKNVVVSVYDTCYEHSKKGGGWGV